jgi:NAD(P)-dependent dehydrogenase (short-subunit alcohol dehydrogenase family)
VNLDRQFEFSNNQRKIMDTGLKKKVVLITGAAKGIGRSTALAFAREGADLGLIDIDESNLSTLASEASELGVRAEYAVADLSTDDGVSGGVEKILQAYAGRIDVLVNNVGAGKIRTFDQLSDTEWDLTLQLNFMSYVRACRNVLPVMRSQGRGVIINNASDLARQPEPVPIDYSASKAAVLALTKGLARSEAANNIRINAVAPGPIWTPFWTEKGGFADTMAAFHKMPPKEAVEHELSLRQLPLKRLGTPEEVANVIVFLSSDLASYVTSSVWGVDGGSIRSLI